MPSLEPGRAAAGQTVRPTHVQLAPTALAFQLALARLPAMGAEARLAVRGQYAAAVLALIRRQGILGLGDGRAECRGRGDWQGNGILTRRVAELHFVVRSLS